MALTDRRRQLLDTDHWRALGTFIERWYAQPLSDSDGHTPIEIEQVARRLGVPLPAALAEWYELVGRRLRNVQDSPTLLGELTIEDGSVCVWTENQGVWSIHAPIDAGDDPVCRLGGDFSASPNEPLSHVLFGMLVSDTMVGDWSGTGIGSLGELRSTVRGGYCDDFSDEQVQRLRAAYKPLNFTLNPFFDEAYLGDDATVIRFHNNVAVEWMTATDEAFAALDGVFGLAPEGGEHEVVAAFDAEAVTQRRHLVMQLPNIETFKGLLAGVGHVGMAVMGGQVEVLRFHIRSKQPRRVLELILAAVPADLLPHLTVATRPVAISVFEVLYPEGKTRFVLPA
jgi:hypothetical protein